MNTTFYGIANYRDPTQTELMEYSAIEYLKWAFVDCGGFVNVEIDSSSNSDLLYNEGSGVYRSRKMNWVYESGGITPAVEINNVVASGSTYDIDYIAGKVKFDSPFPASGSEVRAEFSYRTPGIYKVGEWFKQIQFDSTPYNPQFSTSVSGIYEILANNRIQLPAVVVYVPTDVRMTGSLDQPKGYGLGEITSYHKQNTYLYVLASNFSDCNRIHDILINQKPSCFQGLNKKNILENGVYPLKYDGTLNPSGLAYPTLVDDYAWKRIDINNSSSKIISSLPNFHMSLVVWNTEILINSTS